MEVSPFDWAAINGKNEIVDLFDQPMQLSKSSSIWC
jgi:hypothetical protein